MTLIAGKHSTALSAYIGREPTPLTNGPTHLV
jgi:hypothetical protein